MEFRPCIDIHNGAIKQIVGGSLKDAGDYAQENFTSTQDGAFFAEYYKAHRLVGGHIILLNPITSEYYEATKAQALLALKAYPQGLQIGGGITAENAGEFLEAGASHVIVTSYVFKDGQINYPNLNKLVEAVGKDHIVLDLSCRKRDDQYYIVTDRWQKFTDVYITKDVLNNLSTYCDEFLIHAVDVEGQCKGIERPLVSILGDWAQIPITYAGGVGSYDDIKALKELGHNHINVTIGSGLDIFGGSLDFEEVIKIINEQ